MESMAEQSAFPLADLSDDLLLEVLSRVPALDIVRSCVLVCKRWSDILRTQKLWKDKCIRDYYYPDDIVAAAGEDYKTLYFKNPYNSNLVRNPDARDGYNHWNILSNGGGGFQIEPEPIGCHAVSLYCTKPYQCTNTGCWATSYFECYKEQQIDLLERGCSVNVLDRIRPDIHVKEWYASRFDCSCKYHIHIQLLSKDKTVMDEWKFDDRKDEGRDWLSISHTFSNYPSGVRYIQFKHGGQDTKFWAGNYGVKITLSTVMFDFSHKAGICAETSQNEAASTS